MNAEIALLSLIGALGGLTGGLFGVGGSVFMIPALTEALGPNQHLYQAACMIINFFVAVPAVYQHARAGAINRRTVSRLLPLAVFAVMAGVGISELPFFADSGEIYLRGMFGLFLVAICFQEFWRIFVGWKTAANLPAGGEDVPVIGRAPTLDSGAADRETDFLYKPTSDFGGSLWMGCALIALPTGVIAGLLGVGGGLVAVPLQHRWLHLPLRTAIANSACVILATSCVGAVLKNCAYFADHGYTLRSLHLAAVLIPSAVIGSFVGSRWVHHLPVRIVKSAFFLLLFIAALRLVYGSFR